MTTIAGGLITLEYAAAGLQWRDVGATENVARDADLTTYVQAATAIIEDLCGPVLPTSKTVTFDGGVDGIALPDRASSLTAVVENGVTMSNSMYFFDPLASIVYGGSPLYARNFYPGRLAVAITYVVGYTIVPPTIQLATRELVRHLWQLGMNSQRPTYGDADMTVTPSGFAVPKRVAELCQPFVRSIGFA